MDKPTIVTNKLRFFCDQKNEDEIKCSFYLPNRKENNICKFVDSTGQCHSGQACLIQALIFIYALQGQNLNTINELKEKLKPKRKKTNGKNKKQF